MGVELLKKKHDMNISVCINTYKRVHLLEPLLNQILAQEGDFTISQIIVTDNEPEPNAQNIVLAVASKASCPVIYLHEPEQNIAGARNRSVNAATAEWIAMLDDDEMVALDWLQLLCACAQEFDADAVFAPVKQIIPEDAPNWVPRYGVRKRPNLSTGETMPSDRLSSANLLIRREVLMSRPGPFDLKYGLSGGEDQDLLTVIQAKGAKFVWCAEALAVELLGGERLTKHWFLRRARRGAQDYMLHALEGRHGAVTRFTKPKMLVDVSVKYGAAVLAQLAAYLTFGAEGEQKRFQWKRTQHAQLGKFDILLGRERILEYFDSDSDSDSDYK